MTVLVGGYELPVPPGTSVLRLLAELGLSPRQVAVERNRGPVPRAEFADTRLAAGDRVEVVILFEGIDNDPETPRPRTSPVRA
jgi:thiamine biosynthesis protein ThiS